MKMKMLTKKIVMKLNRKVTRSKKNRTRIHLIFNIRESNLRLQMLTIDMINLLMLINIHLLILLRRMMSKRLKIKMI